MCRKAGVHGASAQSERQQKSPRTEVRGLFTNRRRCGYLRLPLPFAGLASEITI